MCMSWWRGERRSVDGVCREWVRHASRVWRDRSLRIFGSPIKNAYRKSTLRCKPHTHNTNTILDPLHLLPQARDIFSSPTRAIAVKCFFYLSHLSLFPFTPHSHIEENLAIYLIIIRKVSLIILILTIVSHWCLMLVNVN